MKNDVKVKLLLNNLKRTARPGYSRNSRKNELEWRNNEKRCPSQIVAKQHQTNCLPNSVMIVPNPDADARPGYS
jgi:hypothetical protein